MWPLTRPATTTTPGPIYRLKEPQETPKTAAIHEGGCTGRGRAGSEVFAPPHRPPGPTPYGGPALPSARKGPSQRHNITTRRQVTPALGEEIRGGHRRHALREFDFPHRGQRSAVDSIHREALDEDGLDDVVPGADDAVIDLELCLGKYGSFDARDAAVIMPVQYVEIGDKGI